MVTSDVPYAVGPSYPAFRLNWISVSPPWRDPTLVTYNSTPPPPKTIKQKKVTVLNPITKLTVSSLATSHELKITLDSAETFSSGGQLTVNGGMTTTTGEFLSGSEVFAISKGGKNLTPE